MTEINVPTNVSKISKSAFCGCEKLKKMNFLSFNGDFQATMLHGDLKELKKSVLEIETNQEKDMFYCERMM